MPRKNPRRNLTRIEIRSTSGTLCGGWEVRLQRQGVVYSRFFSDGLCGGNRGAMNEAKHYRDALEEQLRPLTVRKMAENPSSRNTSGMVGVRRARQSYIGADDDESIHEFWIAQWTDGHGRRRTRSFSIARYGEEEAWQMAVTARRQGVFRARRVIRR